MSEEFRELIIQDMSNTSRPTTVIMCDLRAVRLVLKRIDGSEKEIFRGDDFDYEGYLIEKDKKR